VESRVRGGIADQIERGGGGGNCGKVSPCGGNIVGSWKITNSCVTNSTINPMNTSCPGETGKVNSFDYGTATFNADGTYSTSTGGSASETLTIPKSCVSTITCDQLTMALNNTDGGASGTCVTSGSNCDCTFAISAQTSTETGTYTTSGTSITTTPASGTAGTNGYCVQGSTLYYTSLPTMSMGTMGQSSVMAAFVATKQ
jgi:hypothetical protein